MNPSALAQIIELVEAKEGHVIVDEIYHGLHYADQRLPSALSMSDQVVVVNSFSKYFGMTGWRLGWMVVPENAVSLVEKLAQNLFICPSSVAQYAALNAFSVEARMEMESNREEFRERRDFMLGELRELGFGVPIVPEGAFYIYAKIPPGLEESEKFCARLLEHHNVAITPGTDFGFNKADEHVRFSYAQNLQVLSSGIENLKSGLMR
jgi:aspartate/methionine/tyrosine aminotransferase